MPLRPYNFYILYITTYVVIYRALLKYPLKNSKTVQNFNNDVDLKQKFIQSNKFFRNFSNKLQFKLYLITEFLAILIPRKKTIKRSL